MHGDLQAGEVTFLFTDVEGSTRLLREVGADAYAAALGAHRRAVRAACTAHGGAEVDTQGDAFFVAFPDAGGAVAAAAEAQELLAGGRIRVRMGLHTGPVLLTDEGYVGEEVHRAARVAAAGHGGQVLLTRATRTLVEVETTDLGEHRVKDFAEPVWLFQLGSDRFPPLRTIANTNLPRPVSGFVGRERELGEVNALLLDGARLVTLVGPGGSGKTRLAIEAAAALVPTFANGVFWVGLAALRDPALVARTVAETLGASEALETHLGERELLLVLDNVEQVVEAAPELGALLEACPNLRVLVTSRELLRIQGEVAYEVPPLVDPEAVDLFCMRGRVEPSETIAELCRRLDNLPLAIELAAARTTALSPRQILERLSNRLDLEGGRDAEARQRTLRATIEWSYDLLEPGERELHARLAVFRGGCELEAAERVLAANPRGIQSLVEKSLLRQADERFWMLETIREFALERLDELGDAEDVRRAFALSILELAGKAEPELAGAGADRWVGRLDAERDNVRAALEWAYDRGEPALGLRIAALLERYWWMRAVREGLAWMERGLAVPGLDPSLRADAFAAAGGAAYFTGDVERAIELFREGLEIARELGDRLRTARLLARLAPPHFVAGRLEEGARYAEEAVLINRELDYTFGLVESLHILAGALQGRGDPDGARELLEESLRLAREIDDEVWISWNLRLLANLALERGDTDRAWMLGAESLVTGAARSDVQTVLSCLPILAVVAAQSGDERRTGLLWGAALRLDEEVGQSLWEVDRAELEPLLGERGEEFELGLAEGRSLELDAALARARLDEPPAR